MEPNPFDIQAARLITEELNQTRSGPEQALYCQAMVMVAPDPFCGPVSTVSRPVKRWAAGSGRCWRWAAR